MNETFTQPRSLRVTQPYSLGPRSSSSSKSKLGTGWEPYEQPNISFSSGLWSVATGSVMAPAGRANNVATRVRVTSFLGAETQRSGSTPGGDPNLGETFSMRRPPRDAAGCRRNVSERAGRDSFRSKTRRRIQLVVATLGDEEGS